MADLQSSPDPLCDSFTFRSPAKTRRTSRARHSIPLATSSPTKQTFELDVGNQISPQKIRVTVEAGSSDAENGYTHFVDGTRIEGIRAAGTSPSRPRVDRRRERTTTTTVPVKGLSDSEDDAQTVTPPKRGRGRPRKSGTPVPAKKAGRTSTPTAKKGGRRKSIGSLVDGDDEDDFNFSIGKGVQVGRGKGRSRSRSIKGTSRKSTPATKQAEDNIVSSTTSKKGRARRNSLLPEEIMVLEDEQAGNIPESQDPQADTDGPLQPIDGNEPYPTSVYSTIRSTITIGANDPDIVIARFDPGNETPRRPGWSSPHIIEGTRGPSPPFDGHPSPSASPEKNGSPSREREARKSPSLEQRECGLYQDDAGRQQDDDEEEDGLREMPEFDTVLESEGFSMISVDSVPSLRDHLSSPANHQEKEPSQLASNKVIASVIGLGPGEDSFSSVPEDVLQAATPGRKAPNSKRLSVQKLTMNDSFSSIPPEVLDAATPARKTHISKLQSRGNSRAEDSLSSIAPEVLKAATPGKDLARPKSLQANNSQAYEDSFSAIPSAILEAATPACARHSRSKARLETDRIDLSSNRLIILDPSRPNSSAGQVSSKPSSPRLPTPEETPSPLSPSTQPEPASEKAQSGLPTSITDDRFTANESSIYSQMRSSPPSGAPCRYTYTAHLRQRRELQPDVTQTPSIVFSSPSLPPPINFARTQPALAVQNGQTERAGLSPIARAGRALQDAVGPFSSPRNRAQSLRSPFKSPIANIRSSSIVTPSDVSSAQERRAAMLSISNAAGSLFPQISHSSTHHDDPFSNSVATDQQPMSQLHKQAYTLGLPEQRRLSDPQLSTTKSEGLAGLSDDAMSWQVEEEVTADDATSRSLVNSINLSAGQKSSSSEPSRLNSGNQTSLEQKWAAERDAVREQIKSANTNQVVVMESDDDASDGAGIGNEVDQDDEDFGLLLETLNSSSPVVQQPQLHTKDDTEKPRRSKLPSPWRKNSKRLVYSDELPRLSSSHALDSASVAKSFANQTLDDDSNGLDLSSFIIPQKTGFRPHVRDSGNLDLSALLASSPNKSKLPVLPKSSQNSTCLPQEPSYTTASSWRTNESSRLPQTTSSASIPQNLGFQPRVRDAGEADVSSIFASSPVKPSTLANNIFGTHLNKGTAAHHPIPEVSSSSAAAEPLGLSSPSRSNSLRNPPQRALIQRSESECSYESSISPTSAEEKENRSINNRTLKWTETVRLAAVPMQPLVSPTKSCLRSPLKTPSHGSGRGSKSTNTSPSKSVAFVSSSPLPSSPTTEPLSPTTWSRDHWLLLSSILQAWKPENNTGSEHGPKGRRRNSTRVISRLLGRKVFCPEGEMVLEQWHLEVVDEFRGAVPGWDEKVIAMRLFACIVGEEQRKNGLVT